MPKKESTLDSGFEPVQLDSGFESVNLDQALPADESSTLKDFLIGGSQGLTLGFGDELAAALQTAGETVTGKSKLQDLYDRYRQHQQEQQEIVKAAQESSPIASLAGNLAGGLIPALATAGGSEAATAGTTMKELGSLPWKQLLARIGSSAAKGAVTGAKVAVPTALGASEHTIEEPLDLAKDVASGAATGAAFGGALSATGTGLKGVTGKILNAADSFDVSRQAKLSFEHGKQGFDITPGKEFFDTAQRQQRADITRITDKFLDGENQLTDELYDSLRQASLSGQKVKVDPYIVSTVDELLPQANTLPGEPSGLLDSLMPRIGRQRTEQLKASLAKLRSGEIDPLEAWNTRKALYELADEVPEVKGLIKGINEGLKSNIEETVPGVAQTAHELQEFIGAGKESLLEGGASAKYSERGAGDIYNVNKRFSQEIKGLLENLTSTRSDQEKARKFGEMMDKLRNLDPMLLKKLNINPNELEKDFQRTGDLFTIAKKLGGSELGQAPFGDIMSTLSGGTVPTLRGGVYKAASMAGQTADLSKRVFDLSQDKLISLAKGLQEAPGMEYLGRALEKGLLDPSGTSKNSILFILMQRPDSRRLIENMFMGGDNGEIK